MAIARAASLAISPRDTRIVAAARGKLGPRASMDDAIRALREATEEAISGGRIYALPGGVIGSLVSGVGIVESPSGVLLVRHGVVLGRFP